MAGLYKRGKIWAIMWYEGNRKCRMSLKTTSKAKANERKAEIERNLDAGLPAVQRADCTIEDFTTALETFLHEHRRPHTAKTLLHVWKKFRAWRNGALRLSDITHNDLREYKAHCLKAYATSTTRSNLLALSSIFGVAIKELRVYAGPNPVKDVGLPKPTERAALVEYLEIEEIARVLDEASRHSVDMHLLFALGVYAGLRKGELLAARWSWIKWRPGRGRIQVQGQGRWQTKSGRARSIPLASELRTVLERYKRGIDDDFILWPNMPEKENPTNPRSDFTEAFEGIVTRAGVGWVTPHKLRHTFASQHAIAGTSLYKIGQWLGHTSPDMTAIYAHLSPEDSDIDGWKASGAENPK